MTIHILKHENKVLGNLLKKVEQLAQFNSIFAQHVDAPVAKHCKVVNFQNHCLIVITDSGTWATQLRFHIPDLLIKLREYPELTSIKAICCKTRPNPALDKPRNKKQLRKMKPISQATVLRTLQAADAIQDQKLKQILEKIMDRLCSRPNIL